MKRIIFTIFLSVICLFSLWSQDSEIKVKMTYRTVKSQFFGMWTGDMAEVSVNGKNLTTLYDAYEEAAFKVNNGNNIIEIVTKRDGDERKYRDKRNMTINSNYNIVTIIFGIDKNGKIANFGIDSNISKRSGSMLVNSLESTVTKMVRSIEPKLSRNSRIAIINISSAQKDTSEIIADRIEYVLINDNFYVVDRYQLDLIREEQRLQMSGDVDDNTAVSIGKFVGASIIITGSVVRTEDTIRLRLRALNTETGQVMTIAIERL